jgi:hypothetical protein
MSPVTGSSAAPPYSPPAASGNTAARSLAAPKSSFVPAPAPPAAAAPSAPAGSTVTLSDQARSAFASIDSMPAAAPAPAASAAGASVYESMKAGIVGAVDDIEDVASEGLHAVTSGVETVVSSANTLVRGVLDSPFVVVSKICDAAGAVIDHL